MFRRSRMTDRVKAGDLVKYTGDKMLPPGVYRYEGRSPLGISLGLGDALIGNQEIKYKNLTKYTGPEPTEKDWAAMRELMAIKYLDFLEENDLEMPDDTDCNDPKCFLCRAMNQRKGLAVVH